MKMILDYDSEAKAAPQGFRDAMQRAADIIGAKILNPITVHVNVGYGEVNGSPITGNILAEAGPSFGTNLTYSQLIADLTKVAKSDEALTFLKDLPKADPTNGGLFFIGAAEEQALGLLPADSTSIEAVAGFSSSFKFDYDQTNGVPSDSFDLMGIAEHELTHALGRYAPTGFFTAQDLTGYGPDGKLDLVNGDNRYFSIDGGKTNLVGYDTNSDPGDFQTFSNSPADPFNAFLDPGRVYAWSVLDAKLMDVLGFDVGAPIAPSTIVISNGPTAPEQVASNGSIEPYLGVGVTDPAVGATETVTVTLSNRAGDTDLGTLSDLKGGTYNATTHTFTATGTVLKGVEAFAQTILDNLVYTPSATDQPGLKVNLLTTVTNGKDTAILGPNEIDVVAPFRPPPPPVITGTVAKQAVNSGDTIKPFAGVTINDASAMPQDAVIIKLTNANGVLTDGTGKLTGDGLTKLDVGTYSLALAAPGTITSELEALIFTPNDLTNGQVTTNFSLTVNDIADRLSATDNNTSVIENGVAPNPPPPAPPPPNPPEPPIPPIPPGPDPNPPKIPDPTPNPNPTPHNFNYTVFDTTTKTPMDSDGAAYTGPVAGITSEYIYAGTDDINVTANVSNVFIHSNSGEDALNVGNVAGTNVLDGFTGSNFLVGSTNAGAFDTFFVDDRSATKDIWSTIVNAHTGDNITVWGITQAGFALDWENNQGAVGFTGLSLHVTAPGHAEASLSLTGFTTADMTNGKLNIAFGHTADLPGLAGSAFLNVHVN